METVKLNPRVYLDFINTYTWEIFPGNIRKSQSHGRCCSSCLPVSEVASPPQSQLPVSSRLSLEITQHFPVKFSNWVTSETGRNPEAKEPVQRFSGATGGSCDAAGLLVSKLG